MNPVVGAGLEYIGNYQRNVEILAKVQSSQPMEESLTPRELIGGYPEERRKIPPNAHRSTNQ